MSPSYLRKLYYGVYCMWEWLKLDKGYKINLKRVRRLYRLMGLEAIGPKPNTSKSAPGHKVYPYLLRGLTVNHSNHVWTTDEMAPGF